MSDERLAELQRLVADGWGTETERELLAEVDRLRAPAQLGSALVDAVDSLYGGESFHVRRYIWPDGVTRSVVVSGLHTRDKGAALTALQSALASLLAAFPQEDSR